MLIPEVPFRLEGERGLLAALRKRIDERGHAVIVAAEGAGQDLGPASSQTDASGNPRLHDIGLLLKQRITEDFASRGLELNLKYIDPSYTIRSVPANAYDSGYCIRLAHSAVHAAMCGRTEMLVGRWHGRFVHVPMQLAIRQRTRSIRMAICGTPFLNRPASRERSNNRRPKSCFRGIFPLYGSSETTSLEHKGATSWM